MGRGAAESRVGDVRAILPVTQSALEGRRDARSEGQRRRSPTRPDMADKTSTAGAVSRGGRAAADGRGGAAGEGAGLLGWDPESFSTAHFSMLAVVR
jgi:hypothetical protein